MLTCGEVMKFSVLPALQTYYNITNDGDAMLREKLIQLFKFINCSSMKNNIKLLLVIAT